MSDERRVTTNQSLLNLIPICLMSDKYLEKTNQTID